MRLSAFCLVLLLALARAAIAQELKFEKYNIAITPPEGWKPDTALAEKHGMLAFYENGDKTQILMVIIDDKHNINGPVDDTFVAQLEQGMEKGGGGKALTAKMIQMGGLKAYERTGKVVAKGKNVSTIYDMVPADGILYSLQGMRLDGDVSQSPEIRKAFASFHFITPPKMVADTSAAYLAGRQVGRFLGSAAGRFVGVATLILIVAVGGIVLLILMLSRRRKYPEIPASSPSFPPRAPSRPPPPLPPRPPMAPPQEPSDVN